MSETTNPSATAVVKQQRSSIRKPFLWITLTSFSVFSIWVMLQVGYFGVWEAGFVSSGSLQILLDLVIGCFLICSWMISDAKARGINPMPWVIAVCTTGTIAALAYLLAPEYQLDQSEAVTQSS
ncbi:hypothetical protein A3715_12845 [Oleiphilus sp. HI0009]|uniref:hypothetical protein n=1 Tax=unclassified Oleiphilus TaxID=2631174 RepID=UPI0007C3252D|nr:MULTISPECIES: hypothetical protein [unclassified Oleiphilus]KZX76386.1 hypothetical protein A3715_12845 [Oleiphilus sp. HI0009]KZY69940.1 hypothetical protein A3738_15565 [Oleiphilus sp. HI0066]KZY71955.1 hypothetical protein A3739_03545 [Oleiphilus sp. HI0067]